MINRLMISCCLVLGLSAAALAVPVTYTASVTADNHYALYVGNNSGVDFIGRNEMGSAGSSGGYNWSKPETFSLTADVGEYIYVAAWSDNGTAQAWIGQFLSSYANLYSGTTWEYFLTFQDLGDGSSAPTTANLLTQINLAEGKWQDVTQTRDNGASPWGAISGISSTADWIWGSAIAPGSGYGEYQLFRIAANEPVPEPATLLLLGSGLAGTLALRRRKKA